MAKLSKRKLTKLLKEAFKQQGINIYPPLIPLVSNHIVENYSTTVLTEDQQDYELFVKSLNEQRLERNKYIAIKTFKKGSSSHSLIMNLLPSVNRYSELFFGGDKTLGYSQFVSDGLDIMGDKYQLTNFTHKEDAIFAYRFASKEIQEDSTPDATELMKNAWCEAVSNKYGSCADSTITKDTPHKYVQFLAAKKQAVKIGAKFSEWCQAQVEQLAFIGVPSLGAINGDKALDRYRKNNNGVGKKRPQENKKLEQAKAAWKKKKESK